MSGEMNTYDKKPVEEVFPYLFKYLEKDLKIPVGFFMNLLQENDWSFIIKTHAVIEAAVSQALASILDEKLLPVFRRLELSDERTGKIIFAKHLDILKPNQYKFVKRLSELRNRVVHNIKEIDFDLQAYVASLDKNQRRSLLNTLASGLTDKAREWRAELFIDSPKVEIWLNMISILLRVALTSESIKLARQTKDLSVKFMMLMQEEDFKGAVSDDQNNNDPSS
jgi:hypothetical protein